MCYHEEKTPAEDEELKVESHARRDRPSWFKAEMVGNVTSINWNKVSALLGMVMFLELLLPKKQYCSILMFFF